MLSCCSGSLTGAEAEFQDLRANDANEVELCRAASKVTKKAKEVEAWDKYRKWRRIEARHCLRIPTVP